MDTNYDDGQDYYEPCSCCGEFGHWAQDCQNKYRMNQNFQCNNQRGGYSNDCQNQIGRQVDQSELDDIRVAIKELTSTVKEVMYRQEILEARHQLLLEQTEQIVTHVRGVVAVIADSGTSSNHNQVDPTNQFSSSENIDSAHFHTVSLPSSFEFSMFEQTPPPRVERVVEHRDNDINQDLISRVKLENKSVKKSLDVPFPKALVCEVSTKPKPDPTHDEKWKKFENQKINSHFLNIIKEDPDNVACLKGLSTQKRRHKCPKQVELSASASAVLLGTLPPELQDPGSLVISVQVGEFKVDNALLDLGVKVNVLPGSLYDQYDFGPLKKVNTTVVLADQTPMCPRGIVKDVLVKVGEFYYPVDFLVLDCVKNTQPIVILGRPFLATAHATINCVEGTVRLRFGDKKLNLKVFQNSSKYIANKCESIEKENHTKEKECFVIGRVEIDEGKEVKKKRNSKRKRKKKVKKLAKTDDTEKSLAVFGVIEKKIYDLLQICRDSFVEKEDCKHPTRPP